VHGDRGPRRYGLLAASLAAVTVVAAVGGSSTDTRPGSWYRGLDQPSWNPPDWLFGPVWTALYLAMAVAAWFVARRGTERPDVRVALAVYAVQLVLNLAWTLVFFGAESPVGGVAVIAALWLAILVTIGLFGRLDRAAAWLLVPYLAWVTYAAALTWAIWRMN
jgi:translocator protein